MVKGHHPLSGTPDFDREVDALLHGLPAVKAEAWARRFVADALATAVSAGVDVSSELRHVTGARYRAPLHVATDGYWRLRHAALAVSTLSGHDLVYRVAWLLSEEVLCTIHPLTSLAAFRNCVVEEAKHG